MGEAQAKPVSRHRANPDFIEITRKHPNYHRQYYDACQVRSSFCDLVIAQALDHATKSIVVLVKHTMEVNTVLALERALARKVDVGIVVNNYTYNQHFLDLQYLLAKGADIWLDQGHELYQLFAIDQRVTILEVDSAYNENLEIITNSSYTMTHVMEWSSHANHSLKTEKD